MAKKIHDFDEIIGHQNLIRYLKSNIEKDNIPNMMIFHGNPGVGKSTIARLTAIEVSTRYCLETREEYVNKVIDEEQSTDSIKIFNMSNIQEKEEEIQNVKSELTIGFSKTGRKVLILDEAHGMSKKAQDAILPELEHLQNGIYVFLCTTEIGVLRESIISRSKATVRLNDLSSKETQMLVRNAMIERNLVFDVNIDMVVALISEWANHRPRNAYNLIENFEQNSLVTAKDLEVFIDTNSIAAMVELLKYLYGNLTLGLDYLDSLKYDATFASMLIELCKVALGHHSKSVSVRDALYIKDFMEERDVKNILQFTAEVAGLSSIIKRRVISAFMKAHVSYKKECLPQGNSSQTEKIEALAVLQENMEHNATGFMEQEIERAPSLEELMATAEIV